MDMLERIIIGFGILLIIAIAIMLPLAVKRQSDFEVACKEAGGIAYTAYKSYNLCLNPTAIVELK